MSTAHLVNFFLSRRPGISLEKATWLADQVVLKRKLKSERLTAHLERAQLTLGMEDDPCEEPTHAHEPDAPLPF